LTGVRTWSCAVGAAIVSRGCVMTGIASAVNDGSRRRIRRRLLAVTGTATIAAWTIAALPAEASVTYPVTRVSVGTFPLGIAVDPLTHQVFVANGHGQTVSAINEATNAVATISLPIDGASTVAVDVTRSFPIVNGVKVPIGIDRSTVYITYTNGSMSVINPVTDKVTATIALPAGAEPSAVAIDTSTHVAYIANSNGSVVVFSCKTNTVTGTLPVNSHPQSIAVDSTTHTIYAGDPNGNTVSVINPTTGVTATLRVTQPARLAVDPPLHTLYVTSASSDGTLEAIDETSSAVHPITVGPGPYGVAVDTATHRVYVSNTGDRTVSIVDGTSDRVVGTTSSLDPIQNVGNVAVDAATHTAYIAMENASVAVVGRTVTPPTLGRLSGSDRYATAVAVSQSQFPTDGSAGAVVLARGTDYPDALVGTPLAKANNAPLLLTSGTSVTPVTLAEIQRVLPTGKTVYVLGGTAAIPSTVDTQLTGLGYQVVRYSGATRYATAVAVAVALGNPTTVLLATGVNFPDALSAGVAAAKVGGVVLLTAGATLPTETATYLTAHAMTTYAVGGPAATADPSATAIVGADRYETAVDVAQKFFTAPTTVGVATGLAFPDALSGGAALGRLGAPLVLVAGTSVPTSASSYLTSVDAATTKGFLFGGPNTVSAAVLTGVQGALVG
jgi:YVTN family beta-propeller protein